jgi:hypothetical protein
MKSVKKWILGIALVYLMIFSALADCSSFTEAKLTECNDEWSSGQDTAWSAYNAAFDLASSNYNTSLEDNIEAYAEEANRAFAEFSSALSVLKETRKSNEESANILYLSDEENCFSQHEQNEDAYNQCMCPIATILNYNYSAAANNYDLAKQKAENSYNSILESASAAKQQSDCIGLSTFWSTSGIASGTLTKDTVVDDYAFNTCSVAANYAGENCVLTADCAAHPTNCCADNAEIDLNNTMNDALQKLNDNISGPDSYLNYKTITCASFQTSEEWRKYADTLYDVGMESAAFNHESADAYTDMIYSINQAKALYDKETNLCVCSGSGEEGDDCILLAQEAMNSSNLNSMEAYGSSSLLMGRQG